jgi:hypothetical protein
MRRLLSLLFCFTIINVYAQPGEQLIKVIVAPDHSDWTYKVGEKVNFTVTVLRFGNPVKNAKIVYEYGPEKLEPTRVP